MFSTLMDESKASDWSKFSNCRFGIFEQFYDYFTLGQILIWALFQYFFLRKPTIPAQLTNFFFDGSKEMSIRVKFENKIFNLNGSKKLQNPILKIWFPKLTLMDLSFEASKIKLMELAS